MPGAVSVKDIEDPAHTADAPETGPTIAVVIETYISVVVVVVPFDTCILNESVPVV